MTTPRTLQIGSWIVSSFLGGALIGGCASSGTEPHAMTAGQHQAAAAGEEQAAAEHQARYDPHAPPEEPRGPSSGAYSACISYESSNCYVRWRSEENRTDQHRKDAEHHRKLAEKHRAASTALVDAEQRFCSGIAEADRDLSPFYHREDVIAVETLRNTPGGGASAYLGGGNSVSRVLGPGAPSGARITFRAVSGMSGEWLQRVVDCHLARNAVIGATDLSMSFCPLAVPHATANVISTRGGFAVDVTSNDEGSVSEIIKRASALAPAGPSAVK